ncbi:hypothetical protein HYV30_01125 [Candidatus Kaiserbacteria bacterium]|nr:hypothetical protein [Candidatus Kaiserbacteria bacterium]
MEIVIVIASILAIALLAWAVNRISSFPICPICAGVAGTWLAMLALRFAGYAVPVTLMAMLIGGSVVGIAYQLERRVSKPRLFKALAIPAGFVAGYGIVAEEWLLAFLAGLAAILITGIFLEKSSSPAAKKRGQLLRELADCCNE